MVSRIWLFGLILGVPILGFIVAEGFQAYLDHQLHLAVQREYPDLEANALAELSVDDLYESADPELREICGTYRNLNLLSSAAVLVGAVGLSIIFTIHLAGFVARKSRVLLLVLFRPGLYLTVLCLLGLVITHAVIAMAALYYGEVALLGRVHVFVIGAIGLGALLGIGLMMSNVVSCIQEAKAPVIGNIISEKEAPILWQRVKEIAEKIGALYPDHIAVGLDPNFFITEADVVCINGTVSGRTLFCSLPLCRVLSMEEFSAIIGHELGHYKGLDTKFSQKFFPIYRGVTSSIESLVGLGRETSSGVIALLPAIAILSYFLECFAVAESRISRTRELAADREGATAASPIALASALSKVHAFAGLWKKVQLGIAKATQNRVFVNVSKIYEDVIFKCVSRGEFGNIAETRLNHPTDSHPTLSDRLGQFGIGIKDAIEATKNVRPVDSALEMIPDVEKIEEEISIAYQAILARLIGFDLKEDDNQPRESGI